MRSCILRSLFLARPSSREIPGGYATRWLTYSRLRLTRRFASNAGKDRGDENDDAKKGAGYNLATAMNTKYKVFHDEDADVILDVSEEQQILLENLNKQEEAHDPYSNLNLNHGITGVYDIEDLVELLEREKAKNIFVASVPKEYTYVDYIVVVNGSSQKHMNALATFVRKVYKLKRHQTEQIPKIEGENSKDWMALDLGNIVLHIMSQSAREHYDLETLWTVGSQYDDKTTESENLNIMDQYNDFLADLQPADDTNATNR
ncbi:mitochondrial assembly of ribosomal large subunit protein 1 [Solenopsis invicta]|uniref:mitochondrial assembly of ribosomal large subunit protein 1 n=1 Tax=Solenopsis invicta TaxID=13686 RepID=UPI0001FEE6C5|nr:mitochondrial assembly of ribosomal large subunit protein 1 [Solenopsis invicta]